MRTATFTSMFAICVLLAGCGEPAKNNAVKPADAPSRSDTNSNGQPAPDPNNLKEPANVNLTPPSNSMSTAPPPPTAAPDGFTPVRVAAGVAALTPENSTILVVGKHTRGGENDPMARTILFEKFTGKLESDPATKALKSASAEIDATSLLAHDPRLTAHLKNEEFLDVEKFPKISFVSTRIEPTAEAGKVNIVGKLTMHGETKEITVPATVTASDAGVTLESKFNVTRSDFKMEHPNTTNNVLQKVELTLIVGKKQERPASGRGR